MDILQNFIINGGFKMALLVSGILVARFTVKWMDVHIDKNDSTFATWLRDADDKAKAIYYGSRFLGVSLIALGALS